MIQFRKQNTEAVEIKKALPTQENIAPNSQSQSFSQPCFKEVCFFQKGGLIALKDDSGQKHTEETEVKGYGFEFVMRDEEQNDLV